MATLHTCFKHSELRITALETWIAFIETMGPKQIGPILNQITGMLLSLCPDWTEEEANIVSRIFSHLILENKDELKDFIPAIYGIPQTDCFSNVRNAVEASRKGKSHLELWNMLLQSVGCDNPFVVQQALIEFQSFVQKNEDYVFGLSCQRDSIVEKTISALLGCCRKFFQVNSTIRRLCAKCLGLVGAVDMSRIQLLRVRNDILYPNFDNRDESISFTCSLMQNHLCEAFRAASDTKIQSHLAFTIQELLKFCGFSSTTVSAGNNMKSTEERKLSQFWHKFPEEVREILTPLLTSKYTIQMAPSSSTTYPLYPKSDNFSDWLKSWALDLTAKIKIDNAASIFSSCRNGIKSGEVTLARCLLPHITLSVILSGTERDRHDILAEILSVLKDVNSKKSEDIDEKGHLSVQVLYYVNVFFSSLTNSTF
jgi:serine/threonine-protein kinase ATR